MKKSLTWISPHKWLNVTEVTRWVTTRDESDQRFVVLLAFLYGFLRVLSWSSWIGDVVPRLLFSTLVGPVFGFGVFIIGGGILNWAVRVFGGTGEVEDTRAAMQLAGLPLLWLMVLGLAGEAVEGIMGMELAPPAITGMVLAGLWLGGLGWSLWLLVASLSRVHATTGVRAMAGVGFAAGLVVMPLFMCAYPIVAGS
ncbi:MAG TPA: YIP1 family protein [Anaerolineales bacterium]|nr:YIP1 family protein [Anaerolineales bacterium]